MRTREWISAVTIGLLLSTVAPTFAFKWHTCPAPPLAVYPSNIGATNSPFVHPGHDLTIYLNQSELKKSGGFSTAPGGNRIRVTFDSLAGSRLVVPDQLATATSATTLTFDFPDSLAIFGRSLAGPVSVEIFVGARKVAQIASADLIALPPRNEATDVLENGLPALAALAGNGDIWVPIHFDGDPMPMPGCEGDFIHPEPLLVADATAVGVSGRGIPTDLLGQAVRLDGYVGDMTVNDVDFYGWLVPERIRAVDASGVEVREINTRNDASDLVIRVVNSDAMAKSLVSLRSNFKDSQPMQILLGSSASNVTTPPGPVDAGKGKGRNR